MADIESLANRMFWERIAKEEQARLSDYARHWAYYRGKHDPQLKIKPGQPNDNVILNLAKIIVNKSTAFLFGKEVEFARDESGEADSEEDYLDQVWEANSKMSLLQNLSVNGAVCGHVFVKMHPEGVTDEMGRTFTRLIALDPAIVRPFWSPDDISLVLWYKIEYEAIDPKLGQIFKKQIIERQENGTWLITNYESKGTDNQYKMVGSPEVWGYDFAPIVDWQNLPAPNCYFGDSDLDDIALNDSINFNASNIERIIRYHAHPKTWGYGFNAKEMEIGADDMVIVRNPDAKIAILEMQSDLSSSRAFLSDLVAWMMKVSQTVNLDPAVVNVGALSGFAIKLLYGDLLEKTETKRRTYGDGLKELNRRLLVLGGQAVVPYEVKWQDPLPKNPTELAAELNVEVNQIGTTSKQTASEELGRNWELEQERIQDEKQGDNNLGSLLLDAFNKGDANAKTQAAPPVAPNVPGQMMEQPVE